MTSFKISFQRLLLAGIVASTSATAIAQATPPAPTTAPTTHEHKGPHMRGQHGPADRQAAIAKRQAALKQKLQITASQEPAWNLFTASMLPEGRPASRLNHDALKALTTPQRIEHMRAQRAERDALMDRRADATLKLYAELTPEQQKVFDAGSVRQHGHGRGAHGGHRAPHAMPHKG